MTQKRKTRLLAKQVKLCFLAEPPLGRLTKWLRILGFSCQYPVMGNQVGDDGKTEAGRDTILLTRRANAQGKNIIFIDENDIWDQLRILDLLLPIRDKMHPFTLCVECNISLVSMTKDEIWADVPEHVYHTQEDFKKCPRCSRVFWPGTHREKMEEIINRIFPK